MNDAQPLVIVQQARATATILVIDDLLLVSSALANALEGKGRRPFPSRYWPEGHAKSRIGMSARTRST